MADTKHSLPVTDGEFEGKVLKEPGLALVDFWAEWCAPCRALSPTIDALAEEYAGKLKVFKLDVDANPGTATKYGIRGLPTVLFFKDGQLVDRLVGAHPRENLVKGIQRNL